MCIGVRVGPNVRAYSYLKIFSSFQIAGSKRIAESAKGRKKESNTINYCLGLLADTQQSSLKYKTKFKLK